MATYYVKNRKTGPVGVLIVEATSPEDAMSKVLRSAAAGEEYDIMAADTVNSSGITGVTGPTGP